MQKKAVVAKTKQYLKKKFAGEGSGHDWWHIERVYNAAKSIARKEKGADSYIVELGALLHDVADWKFNKGDLTIGAKVAEKWLKGLKVDQATIDAIKHIVENVSFKGAGVKSSMKSLEGKIVQDADRLDAIGAIGIARAFAYGGHKNRPIYNPDGKAHFHTSFTTYEKGSDSSIHHFYEKLLFLKKQMNTRTGKMLAAERHKFLETYLKKFHAEWNGKQ